MKESLGTRNSPSKTEGESSSTQLFICHVLYGSAVEFEVLLDIQEAIVTKNALTGLL